MVGYIRMWDLWDLFHDSGFSGTLERIKLFCLGFQAFKN